MKEKSEELVIKKNYTEFLYGYLLQNSHFEYRKEKKMITLKRNMENGDMWLGVDGSCPGSSAVAGFDAQHFSFVAEGWIEAAQDRVQI
jgi:hypothetical protein